MDKTALLNYALTARKDLESQIALSLNKLGIFKDEIKKANLVGEYTVIEGTEETFPKRIFSLRDPIIEEVKTEGFNNVVEEFAYTWFNRIIALRFMEVHDYFDHGLRVLTSRDGSFEPEILKNVDFVMDSLRLDKAVVEALKAKQSDEELYRYILFSQCNALSRTLPMLFDEQDSYMELLLPNNLLSTESVIRKITEIPEEDFKNDIEVIGWLYQFYNSVKKDEVFAAKETITKDTLPAVTQLFTPDWIVRYMAENSVGRIWEEAHPDKSLKAGMKYYVEDAEQVPEVQKQLDAVKYKDSFEAQRRIPEDIKIIEPCCGSGHILVYVFDLLFKMYKAKGYLDADIPAKILKNNLFGLDVDKRAAQLSQFALMMKARSVDRRFFSKDRITFPQVYEIQDSKLLVSLDYKKLMIEFGFTSKSRGMADYLVDTFTEGKVIGSLLKVRNDDYQYLVAEIDSIKKTYIANLFQQEFGAYGLERLKELAINASVLSQKYDVMITNPPYCGTGNVEKAAKSYFSKFYFDSKDDFFAMFMQTDLVKESGFLAMINMHSWMFLDSFSGTRLWLLKEYLVKSLIHLGIKAFEEIGNDVVQTCSFVMKKCRDIKATSIFIRLVDCKDYQAKQKAFFSPSNRFCCSTEKFLFVPGYLFTPYYCNERFLDNFSKGQYITSLADFTGSQNITGDNERFLRCFWEVDANNICENKWMFYAKGGNYRKYYGNLNLVVDWRPSARHFYDENKTSNLLDKKYWYKEGITYSAVTSRGTGFRYLPQNCLFDKGGPSIIVHDRLVEILSLLNSKVAAFSFSVFNPSINLQVKDIKSFPLIFSSNPEVKKCAEEDLAIAKDDYDSRETSFEFKKMPLEFSKDIELQALVNSLIESQKEKLSKIRNNEVFINQTYADLYGVNLDMSFEDRDFPVDVRTQKDCVVELLSYFCGCLLGRYSFEREGLIYAGGDFDKKGFSDYVCDDGIIPIYNYLGIDGGLTQKICSLIAREFGDENYKKNLDFIAGVLAKKEGESSEETLNRYLNEGFYSDHLKIYQKRPIYWMFSSGKHGAFKCLIYLHRYTKDTLARINTQYFLPRTAMYKAERKRLENLLLAGNFEAKAANKIQADLDEAVACEKELLEYGQVLDHMANQFIDLDLDDGVKANYEKFQGISLIIDGATIEKDLLVPIK
jgi:hypothetical protein